MSDNKTSRPSVRKESLLTPETIYRTGPAAADPPGADSPR